MFGEPGHCGKCLLLPTNRHLSPWPSFAWKSLSLATEIKRPFPPVLDVLAAVKWAYSLILFHRLVTPLRKSAGQFLRNVFLLNNTSFFTWWRNVSMWHQGLPWSAHKLKRSLECRRWQSGQMRYTWALMRWQTHCTNPETAASTALLSKIIEVLTVHVTSNSVSYYSLAESILADTGETRGSPMSPMPLGREWRHNLFCSPGLYI